MTIALDAVVTDKIGYASHQNSAPILRQLTIRNLGGETINDVTLSLRSDPGFLADKVWRFDQLRPDTEIAVVDRDVQLSASVLAGLTEAVSASLILTATDASGQELAVSCFPIELLAHNEWGGIGAMAELIPAFVMPNDPAVDRVLKAASDCLRRMGKPDQIDGYESKQRTRVWQLASAIWSAVAGMRLSYALPPAGFEQVGQKIRTPSQILDGRIATCLDATLLFAAALEQARLNPLVIMTKGHAFVGVWLQPSEFSALTTDEAAALRRRFDLDELIVFETTLVTQKNPATFTQAITAGYAQIREQKDDEFELAIDIRRGRMQKIKPLGVAQAGNTAAGDNAISVAEAVEEPPSLPSFDEAEPEVAATPAGRVKNWQRKLLNLTTANRLLHLSDTAKAIWLSCPDPGKLEDILAAGKKVRIKPMPDLGTGGRDEDLYNQQTISNLTDEVGHEALTRGEVLSPLPKTKLDGQLIDLFRKAKSDIDEGGANTLFLAVGFLKWKKSSTETRSYRAPLILLPVKLERKSAVSGVVMSHHEDEPRFNLTLLELLRQDFELTIPKLEGDLPTDQSGIDVPLIWRLVRDAVKDMPGFEVVADVALGTFSFAKYLMWKDLVDREDKLRESPLVKLLIERDGQLQFDTDRLPRVEDLDSAIEPAELFAPLPADSSQLRAVIASARGQNFVLNGPPGTGKSQTIANMIAHNLALGRRVLFVAEKRAALDVVHRRLTDKGLASFCLELHSAKATKSAVLKQLGTAWDTRDTLTADQWQAQAREAKLLRDKLNETVALLHRREENGYTIHLAIGRFLRDGDEHTPKLGFLPNAQHTLDDMDGMRDVARRLGFAFRDVTDLPADLASVTQSEWTNGWQDQVVAAARALPAILDELDEALGGLVSASRLPLFGNDLPAAKRLLEIADLCLSAFGRDLSFALAPDAPDRISIASKAIDLLDEYRAEEAALSAPYGAEIARQIDLDGLNNRWAEAQRKFWFFASLAKRKLAREMALAGEATGQVDPETDLPHLATMKALLLQIDDYAPKVATIPEWQGMATRKALLRGAIELATQIRQMIAAQADSTDALIALREGVSKLVIHANELLSEDGAVARTAARLRTAITNVENAVGRFDGLCRANPGADFPSLRARAETIIKHERRLRDWASWRRVRDEAVQLDLIALIEGLETGRIANDRTDDQFEIAYARWFALQRMDAEPLLRNFQPGEHADCIARFRRIDDQMSDLASQYIRAKICGGIPAKDGVAKNSGYGALRHQLQLQRPSKAIRQLATEMGEAFTQLAPCMLMSPLSIAQYLPTDQVLFDLVIFDEASQITPWDAIGAMARGKQVIIAGDPKQMPPTNDFQKQGNVNNTEDDDTEDDMDSILEECLGAGVPEINLDWHYRSRHESLITFSNHRYYQNRLVTFPAPDTRPSAVRWRKVDGVFAKGKDRTNAIEAQAIVDEAVRYLRDPKFVDERGRPLSLGVITMNIQQMSLVERLLDVARERHPGIEHHFNDDRLEPVCVRNLETAQGDERDVILLGVSFGPAEPGGKTMSMNFGKINGSGGTRRLNVAVTRARREMQVFTSFDPGMIDLTRTGTDGMRDLKAFLEFAQRGKDALASANKGSLGGYDSPFEEAVAHELRRRGWQVVPQVGVSKFRIDLGVVHPDFPGDYLLGVECDGATYHSAATARDRDKVRAAILEGLGWKLLRVWSTEWWFNRERAVEHLHLAIVAALEENRRLRSELVFASDFEPQIDEAPVFAEQEDGVEHASNMAREYARSPSARQDFARNDKEPVLPLPDAPRDDIYRFANFSNFAPLISPETFYEASYYPALRKLVAHVVQQEGPIAESQLVNRIARAHGFQRSGGRIHNRVMHLARNQHHVASDGGAEPFVWASQKAAAMGVPARFPASEDHIRQIEDIAKAELKSVNSSDPVEIARLFGVRRLTATARARIESALADE